MELKRYLEQIRLSHTWKKGKSLEQLWDQCQDIDDVEWNEFVS